MFIFTATWVLDAIQPSTVTEMLLPENSVNLAKFVIETEKVKKGCTRKLNLFTRCKKRL